MKKKEELSAEYLPKYAADICKEIAHWQDLKENGGQDPFWEDGINMNLTRNHVIYAKEKIREICEATGAEYPEEYAMDTPPEVDSHYVARVEDIRIHAKQSLALYLNSEDYRYIQKEKANLTAEEAKKASVHPVLGYVDGLRRFIAEDDLISMRRHEHPAGYLESFKECRKRIEEMIRARADAKTELPLGQLSIFDIFAIA